MGKCNARKSLAPEIEPLVPVAVSERIDIRQVTLHLL
jgi:hypothetical protein